MQSQNVVQLSQNQVKYDLENTVIDIFDDPTAQLTFEQIRYQKFMRATLKNINSGYTDSKMWYRINVRNESDKKWVFVIFGTLIDEIELFEIKADRSIKKRISGDHQPFSTREIDSPVFGFYMDIPQNQTQTMYLGIKSQDPIEFSLHIEDTIYYDRVARREMYKWFFYFGMLFMMFVYNLLLYFSIRDIAYLYYVLYIASFGLFQFAIFGYGTQFIYGENIWITNRASSFLGGISTIFIALFSYKFLNIEFFYPKLKWIYVYLVLCGFVIAVINLPKPTFSNNQFIASVSLLNTFLMVVLGILVVRKGYPPARYYMIAWGVLFFSIAIFLLNVAKILPETNTIYLILPFGGVVEVILLSFGLGNRIKTIEREKINAEKETLKQLKENEEVRTRIARDLHDDLGSTLSSIRILSEFAQNETVTHPEKVPNLLDKIKNSTQKLQENLQDIVWTAQTKDNSFEELLARMRLFGGEILEAKNIDYRFKIDKTLHNLKISPNVKYDIFMIFKESIHNIVKYAKAKKVQVNFGIKNNLLTLTIQDDGVGFDCFQEKEGNGLKNMPHRADNIGGKVEIISIKDKGTTITFTMPVPI
ncbi:MAG: 7TM diverse intracellular signaling domain-containing protein [Arcicella sp.]|nr:7TM diverse intracellular signaling domain-containing protein [Arcicella sp.]